MVDVWFLHYEKLDDCGPISWSVPFEDLLKGFLGNDDYLFSFNQIGSLAEDGFKGRIWGHLKGR